MTRILIVEDDANKLQKITQALMTVDGVDIANITNVIDATTAKRELTRTFFDLLILDIAIPERIDQEVSPEGGIELLHEILTRDKYKQPAHVVGITSFQHIYTNATQHFSRESLIVIYYDQTSEDWIQQLQAKIRQIIGSNKHRLTEQINNQLSNAANSRCALIMKGGGVKALAYVGALRALERYYSFDWFIGTSAGAIAAAILGAGFTRQELQNLLWQKRFSDFLDSPFYMLPLNLLMHKGLYHAKSFTAWIDRLLAEKLNSATRVKLSQLPHRVTIYASRRGRKALVFDSRDPKTLDVAVSHAVRCSISIPGFFIPAREEGMRVFDGGLQNNYPVDHLLGNNPNTDFVGLYLGSEVFEGEERDPPLLKELFSIWSESNDAVALERYRDKTIIIDTRPISTIDFRLTPSEKEFLISAGEAAALNFLARQRRSNGPAPSQIEQSQERLAAARSVLMSRKRRWWQLK